MIFDGSMHQLPDVDPDETQEWLDSLDSVVNVHGPSRARYLLARLLERAQRTNVDFPDAVSTPYVNTITSEDQPWFPGDEHLERRIRAFIRWNAAVMVSRANHEAEGIGGHLSTFASSASLYEIGFNHFFHGKDNGVAGDHVYFQGHAAPGIYARAFLEHRLDETDLDHFRREIGRDGKGLSSYPHPRLMPEFWEFPTVSMGLGPLTALYHARFNRYLHNREIDDTSESRVWAFIGDGETDEPETLGSISLAAREKLDNLVFVVNCNLQRLDGPVRGNGQIIQELEALFTGAGWNVIKVLWGSDWDALFARDHNHALLKAFAGTVDGQYQTLGANDGAYNQQHFFALDPQLRALVAHMSLSEIDALKRGGHDFRKLYAAFAAAVAHKGQPTVILAKTKKGYGMGRAGESRMTAHQEKKLDLDALREFRDRFNLPLSDRDVEELRFLKPAEDSAELRYLRERRAALGGPLPARSAQGEAIAIPALDSYAGFALSAGGKEMSTTMAVVRLISALLRDRVLGPRLVPIVADEARTFGMAALFRQIGIYSPLGQLYEPEDAGSLLSYRESRDGQLLEEGITEAGALSSWVAAATSYSVHGVTLLPIYIYYSIFGFQRVGDLIWAAADQRARGFLLGATAGRTTLGGEGLQHQDGSSHLVAATIPNCRAYDPAFAGELAVIFDHGARRMLQENCDEFYYLTVMNENYAQPDLPAGAAEGVIRGMYRFVVCGDAQATQVRLLGAGAILREVLAAGELLRDEFAVSSEVWSVTSFSELAREARECERWNRLNPLAEPHESHLERSLVGAAPIVAASDYVRAVPQMLASFLPRRRYVVLGTDGFGRSDTRAALREFFEVDRYSIVLAALQALADSGAIARERWAAAVERYGKQAGSRPSWER